MKTQKTIDHITDWMKDYLKESQQKGFVIGVSGGIDSAVTSTLCATTGKPTLCVELPIHQHKSQVSRARKHIEQLESRFANVSSVKVDLSNTFDTFKANLPEIESKDVQDFSLANSRARLRMTTLYYFAGIHSYLVAGTGNKVEDFGVGFYTKYGDGGVDLSPLADLMKSEVFEIAKDLSVINEIQEAEPTDGLFGDSRTDEDQIGASYDELEWAMEFDGDQSEITDRQQEVLKIYKKLHSANQHKMQAIPVCEIPEEFKD
ncbi:NAD(+) synthase [Psychroflexus lacisalsi]|jgi:NAD+ synthase|uniref:NH(3)-dependent NAD(+) synthetase n=1 Tax=Psychroflexus lacisalsi TaxID=503928 RepID=A0ABN1KDP2_9FLAO|nr:NAD(+) synthase [Psychroflexus lacisalsi]MBZ9620268.1 NAD(+) synthase [Psychroflexus lacisalsi]